MQNNFKTKVLGFDIRALDERDASEKYLSWLKDTDVLKFLEIDNSSYNSIEDLISYIKGIDNTRVFLFGIFHNNEHIGNLTVNSIDYKRGTFDMGYLIGNKEFWGTKAGEAAIVSGLKFAFEVLSMRKIFGGIYSKNLGARILAREIGFVEEAILLERGFVDGVLDNVIVTTMTHKFWFDKCSKNYQFIS